jgi:hypothetical protein
MNDHPPIDSLPPVPKTFDEWHELRYGKKPGLINTVPAQREIWDAAVRSVGVAQPTPELSLLRVYHHALENIKFALNNSRADDEALHTIGNEISWALSHQHHPTPGSVQHDAECCAHGTFAWLWSKGRDWKECLSAALNSYRQELASPGCEANSVVRRYYEGRPAVEGKPLELQTRDELLAYIRKMKADKRIL